MVRVADAAAHFTRAKAHGATINSERTDYPYGERQYSAQDLAGDMRTFSQTVSDVDPASRGEVLQEGWRPLVGLLVHIRSDLYFASKSEPALALAGIVTVSSTSAPETGVTP